MKIKKLFLFILLLPLFGCPHNDCICPDKECKPQIVYEQVKVPVYINPLDNYTIEEPTKLSLFKFDMNGKICLTDDNFKLLLNDLTLLKTERDYYYDILKTIKNSKLSK